MINELINALLKENIPWRIIGLRRTTNTEMFNHLMSVHDKMREYSFANAKLYGYLQTFENNLNNLHKQYWSVELFQDLLKDYYKEREI